MLIHETVKLIESTEEEKTKDKHWSIVYWGETFYSLLVTCYSVLVTFYSLLVTFYSLLVTYYWLLVTFYSLLVAF